MKLISWSVNGLRAVLKKNFLEFLGAEKRDVLCLQEAKCTRWFQRQAVSGRCQHVRFQ
jgi:exonuclease III